MAYRLVGTVADRPVELLLEDRPVVLGSAPECELRVEHASVSRRHAQLTPAAEGVEVLDLGSKNGTYVAKARLHRRQVSAGTVIRFGQVTLMLETVAEADTVAAVELAPPPELAAATPSAGTAASTGSLNPFERFAAGPLRQALDMLAAGEPDPTRLAQLVGAGLAESLPVSELEICWSGEAGEGRLFQMRHDDAPGDYVTAESRRNELRRRCRYQTMAAAQLYAPLLDTALALVALADTQAPTPEFPATASPALPEPVTVDPVLRSLYQEAQRVARTDVGVLICGESGSGKEVLARFIHQASPRLEGPFVALNCAALPRDLLEAELFGIERGVATGVDPRDGRFELADGGTLFLDEIGDMSAETQAMILRVLQEGEVYRIGGSEPRRVSVRVIAATNQPIEELMTSGRFREDLYFRIATWTAMVPPLRQRNGDIPNLAAYFLAREARRIGAEVRGISQGALDALQAFDWPGNVRQLENEMARAVAFIADGGLLESTRLSPEVAAGPVSLASTPLSERLRNFERLEILRALQRSLGDTTRACELLGIGRSTMYRRMKALGVRPMQRRSTDHEPQQ